MLARRFPEILEFFGITLKALLAVVEVIWEDNFFVAMGPWGPIFGRILGCTMGNITSMPLCRVYYFCSLEEAMNEVGMDKFIYCKSGGDDALCLVWEEEDLLNLHRELNALPDGWNYELRLPSDDGMLPFFDVELRWKKEPNQQGGWFIETGVYFKEADELLRTDASSFWSWDHAEALLRSHLDRVAKICSSPENTIEGMKKMGVLLARRRHPMEQIFLSFARLNPTFLAEDQQERTFVEKEDWDDLEVFGTWSPDDTPFKKRLSGTVPFGGPVNEHVKRTTREFLNEIARRLRGHDGPDVEVTVNNSPFKCLSRTLPVAKICPPKLLGNNLVYRVGPDKGGPCGIGQVGFRPVVHRMNEHFWDIQGKRGQYFQTDLNPITQMEVCGAEENRYMRLALEAFEIAAHPQCVTHESIDLGPWKLLIESLGSFRFLRGGAIPGAKAAGETAGLRRTTAGFGQFALPGNAQPGRYSFQRYN